MDDVSKSVAQHQPAHVVHLVQLTLGFVAHFDNFFCITLIELAGLVQPNNRLHQSLALFTLGGAGLGCLDLRVGLVDVIDVLSVQSAREVDAHRDSHHQQGHDNHDCPFREGRQGWDFLP